MAYKNFADYKKQRQSNFDSLAGQLDKINPERKSQNFTDDRYWYPKRDKSGNGFAVIRFLDAPIGEESPCVRYWRYAFQGPTGGWYIENSLTTFDKPDPAAEYNSALWAAGQKELATKQKRKLIFTANIMVVNDPQNPENNGKVFLFKFGKKIFNKINSLMFPDIPDEPRVNIFDYLEGADFRLKIKNEDGWPSYNDSVFAAPGPISLNGKPLTEKEIDKVMASQHSLAELMSDKHFKSYADLKARLDKVLGTDGRKVSVTAPAKATPAAVIPGTSIDEEDDDINASFFEKMSSDLDE